MAKRSPFPPSFLQSRQEAGTARRGFALKPLALAVVVVGPAGGGRIAVGHRPGRG